MTQGMTISEQAKTLAKKILDQPATEHDIAVVERQLGRYPRGMVLSEHVACAAGLWLWSRVRCCREACLSLPLAI